MSAYDEEGMRRIREILDRAFVEELRAQRDECDESVWVGDARTLWVPERCLVCGDEA